MQFRRFGVVMNCVLTVSVGEVGVCARPFRAPRPRRISLPLCNGRRRAHDDEKRDGNPQEREVPSNRHFQASHVRDMKSAQYCSVFRYGIGYGIIRESHIPVLSV